MIVRGSEWNWMMDGSFDSNPAGWQPFSIPVATVSECSSTSPHLDRSLLAALWRYWADYVVLAMTDRGSE